MTRLSDSNPFRGLASEELGKNVRGRNEVRYIDMVGGQPHMHQHK
jgi:hypothetical protein